MSDAPRPAPESGECPTCRHPAHERLWCRHEKGCICIGPVPASREWTCPCGYMNIRPVCTHCFTHAPSPPASGECPECGGNGDWDQQSPRCETCGGTAPSPLPPDASGVCACPCTDARPLDDPCGLCGHPSPPSPASDTPERGRMSEKRFEDLAVWVETCAPAAEPFAGRYFIQEARRARAAEQTWKTATHEFSEIVTAKDHEIAALRRENERLSELLWGSRCVYCGEIVGRDRKNQDIADEVLRAHVLTCPKHPVAAEKARADRAEAEAARLRGIIEGGPHAGAEEVVLGGYRACGTTFQRDPREPDSAYACNCWKASALKDGEQQPRKQAWGTMDGPCPICGHVERHYWAVTEAVCDGCGGQCTRAAPKEKP